ncbi:Uncharacterized protein DAT39_013625 [Clarias magur]|uniref:Uncharacterized protein n=1 Tax=Clarias magur TaxID=1594786 RepID=A0A8J4XCZ5_CLAMG|nr:Uncharacterized protein DAT39_013625 [Clarias magur]
MSPAVTGTELRWYDFQAKIRAKWEEGKRQWKGAKRAGAKSHKDTQQPGTGLEIERVPLRRHRAAVGAGLSARLHASFLGCMTARGKNAYRSARVCHCDLTVKHEPSSARRIQIPALALSRPLRFVSSVSVGKSKRFLPSLRLHTPPRT